MKRIALALAALALTAIAAAQVICNPCFNIPTWAVGTTTTWNVSCPYANAIVNDNQATFTVVQGMAEPFVLSVYNDTPGLDPSGVALYTPEGGTLGSWNNIHRFGSQYWIRNSAQSPAPGMYNIGVQFICPGAGTYQYTTK